MQRSLAIVLTLLLVDCAAAAAQEPGHAGVTMGYPASIGVMWHVTDDLAIRPEFNFDRASNGSDSTLVPSTTAWSVGVGASALFYVATTDNLRTYVAPRFTYARTSGSSAITPTNSYSFFGLFGAQYAVGSKFSVFGETGLGYSRRTISSSLGNLTVHASDVGLRTGAGIILYF
jgi:hypothetical protein